MKAIALLLCIPVFGCSSQVDPAASPAGQQEYSGSGKRETEDIDRDVPDGGKSLDVLQAERDECKGYCFYKDDEIRKIVAILRTTRDNLAKRGQKNLDDPEGVQFGYKWVHVNTCYEFLEQEETKRLVVSEWAEGLRKRDAAFPFQLSGASLNCGRNVLGEEYWKILKNTDSKSVLAPIAKSIGARGNLEDLSRLEEKQSYIARVESNRDILRSISGVIWRRKRGLLQPSAPEPAMIPPLMPDHFPVDKIVLLKKPYVYVPEPNPILQRLEERSIIMHDARNKNPEDWSWGRYKNPPRDGGQ